MSEQGHASVKVYLLVFLWLGIFTAITVGASYLHMPASKAVVVALIIATIKASIVATWFMHLKTEHKIIYSFLALTAAFVVVLVTLPLLDSMHTEYEIPGSIPAVTPSHAAEPTAAEAPAQPHK